MAEHRLHWIPLDMVELLTHQRFTRLSDQDLGALLRKAAYVFLHNGLPGVEGKDPLGKLAAEWMGEIKAAQQARSEAMSIRNRENAVKRYSKLPATRMRSHATASKSQAPVPASTPQPPNESHKDFHRLSWGFYEDRKRLFADEYFNPWNGKELRLCKSVMDKARGNLSEVRKRYDNLRAWSQIKPDFYPLTPAALLSQWDRLIAGPNAVPAKPALRAVNAPPPVEG